MLLINLSFFFLSFFDRGSRTPQIHCWTWRHWTWQTSWSKPLNVLAKQGNISAFGWILCSSCSHSYYPGEFSVWSKFLLVVTQNCLCCCFTGCEWQDQTKGLKTTCVLCCWSKKFSSFVKIPFEKHPFVLPCIALRADWRWQGRFAF